MNTNHIIQHSRQEEVQEIIGEVPSWIVRAGTIVIFAITLLVICLGLFSSFPSRSTGRVVIQVYPALTAVKGYDRKEGYFFIAPNNAVVKKDDPLVFYGSADEYSSMLRSPDSLNALKERIIYAPVGGRVMINEVLPGSLADNKPGNEVLAYLADPRAVFYALLYLDQTAIPGIKGGQAVKITVNGYPEQLYGSLKGTVEYISDIPVGDKYIAKVSFRPLPDTATGAHIHFRPGLQGTGEIVTARENLFRRMLASSAPR